MASIADFIDFSQKSLQCIFPQSLFTSVSLLFGSSVGLCANSFQGSALSIAFNPIFWK